jgi:hypothetical protein
MDNGLESRAGRVKGRKSVALCAVAIFVLIGLLYLAGFTLEWHRTQISRSLVGELQRLEVGKTTEAQIRKISDQYAGRYSPANTENQKPQPASYDVSVWSPYMMIAGSARTLPGLKRWGLFASLEVEHSYLSHLHLSLGVSRSDGFGLISTVRLTGTGGHPVAAPDGMPYYVYEAHITGPPGEALVVELGPTATLEERKRGFGFNFSCLTALRECRHVCDTMPSAWRDLSLRGRLTYEDGSPLNDYRECGKGTP